MKKYYYTLLTVPSLFLIYAPESEAQSKSQLVQSCDSSCFSPGSLSLNTPGTNRVSRPYYNAPPPPPPPPPPSEAARLSAKCGTMKIPKNTLNYPITFADLTVLHSNAYDRSLIISEDQYHYTVPKTLKFGMWENMDYWASHNTFMWQNMVNQDTSKLHWCYNVNTNSPEWIQSNSYPDSLTSQWQVYGSILPIRIFNPNR